MPTAVFGRRHRNMSTSTSLMATSTQIRGGAVAAPDNLEDVERLILKAGMEQKLVVIDFSATWCGYVVIGHLPGVDCCLDGRYLDVVKYQTTRVGGTRFHLCVSPPTLVLCFYSVAAPTVQLYTPQTLQNDCSLGTYVRADSLRQSWRFTLSS
jgi:hypothetical protein